MIVVRNLFQIDLPVRADVWHALAEGVESIPGLFRRWNLRRLVTSDLRGLSRAERADIGLDGVDEEEMAQRLVR